MCVGDTRSFRFLWEELRVIEMDYSDWVIQRERYCWTYTNIYIVYKGLENKVCILLLSRIDRGNISLEFLSFGPEFEKERVYKPVRMTHLTLHRYIPQSFTTILTAFCVLIFLYFSQYIAPLKFAHIYKVEKKIHPRPQIKRKPINPVYATRSANRKRPA